MRPALLPRQGAKVMALQALEFPEKRRTTMADGDVFLMDAAAPRGDVRQRPNTLVCLGCIGSAGRGQVNSPSSAPTHGQHNPH